MEALSQLDIPSPDHVSVITRDGKMTVSVTKDGAALTVSLPVRTSLLVSNSDQSLNGMQANNEYRTLINTNPLTPLQQDPELKQINTTDVIQKYSVRTRNYPLRRKRKAVVPNPNSKLDEAQVREIKSILADEEIMSKFRGVSHAYSEIGRAYNISGCAVSHIARGISWKHVSI